VRWAQPKHERFSFAVKKVLVALHCRSLFSPHFTLQGGGRGCELYPMQCRLQSTLRGLPNRAAHHISATRTCVHSATIHHYQASVLLSPGSRASPCVCVREEKKYRGSRSGSCVRGRAQLIQPCTATCIPCTKYLHCAEVEQLLRDHTASLARSQHVKSHQRR
jgi:hypothetical protein